MISDLVLNELHSNNNTFGEDFDKQLIQQRSQQRNTQLNDNTSSICDVISKDRATTDCSHQSLQSTSPLFTINSINSSASLPSLSLNSSPKHDSNSHSFNLINSINDNNAINNKDKYVNSSNKSKVISVLNEFSKCDANSTSTSTTTSISSVQTPQLTITPSNHSILKRVYLDDQTMLSLTVNDFVHHWKDQELYINSIESQLKQFNRDNCDLISLRESEEKLKQQQLEANRRENILVMRLTTKEQEMQEYLNQIQELKQSQVPSNSQLQSTLVDPAVNLMFEKMKKEIELSKLKVEEMQNELKAWKFTPDSNTGKRLMAKCRLLYQENEELGKMISSGRIGKLEAELALQRNFSEEMKKSQAEQDEFLLELDEDVEGMQNTIYYLQQQLKEAKEKLVKFENNANSNDNSVEDNYNNHNNSSNNVNKTTDMSLLTSLSLHQKPSLNQQTTQLLSTNSTTDERTFRIRAEECDNYCSTSVIVNKRSRMSSTMPALNGPILNTSNDVSNTDEQTQQTQ